MHWQIGALRIEREIDLNALHTSALTLVACFSCITWMALAFVGSHAFSVFASVLTCGCRQKDHQYHFTQVCAVDNGNMSHKKTGLSFSAKKNKNILTVGNKCPYNQSLRILWREIHKKHYFGALAPYINNSLFALVILMNRVYGPPHFMTHYISHMDWEAAQSCATSGTFQIRD